MSSARAMIFLQLVIVFTLTGISSTRACKYNVRETGFVDLDSRLYSLFVFVDVSVSEQKRKEFSSIAKDFIEDTNIEYEIVDITKQPDHAAIQLLNENTPLPSAVFISPDGLSMAVQMDNLKVQLADIISSPKREEIIKKIIKNYAVLLFIKGNNEEENQPAFEIAQASIEHITGKMDMMPKTIENPPVIVTIEKSDILQEKILLWGLGLADSTIANPQVAVIYGKARWLGPIISGERLTKSNIVDLLLVVGADCECGLDKAWLQGTMLPVKWDLPLQKQVAKNLGFDAENPYVRMEMMAIMRNSLLVNPGTIPLHAFPGTPTSLDTPISNTEIPNDMVSKVNKNSPLQKSFQIILSLLVLVFLGGVAFVVVKIRANQRR